MSGTLLVSGTGLTEKAVETAFLIEMSNLSPPTKSSTALSDPLTAPEQMLRGRSASWAHAHTTARAHRSR